MEVTIRSKLNDAELKYFYDVSDVSEGVCGMVLIESTCHKYLITIAKDEYLEILKT